MYYIYIRLMVVSRKAKEEVPHNERMYVSILQEQTLLK